MASMLKEPDESLSGSQMLSAFSRSRIIVTSSATSRCLSDKAAAARSASIERTTGRGGTGFGRDMLAAMERAEDLPTLPRASRGLESSILRWGDSAGCGGGNTLVSTSSAVGTTLPLLSCACGCACA